MREDFSLDELKKFILDKEQPIGFDEHILLMAEYIGDKDIIKASEDLVEQFYKMFKIVQEYAPFKNQIKDMVKECEVRDEQL